MRRVLILVSAAIACAMISPARPRPASAARAQAWPPLSSNNQWVMVETDPMLNHPGGAEDVLAVCRRAKAAGYNGLMLWDANLWERQLPPGYLENAETLKAGLHDLGFTLMIEMCPRGIHVAQWSGDETMCEPRPANPHPEEKDYRYFCMAHPGVIGVWEEQIKRAEQIYHPLGWLLQYDEIRVAGIDERCRASGKSPGQLLRENVQKTVAMVRRTTPGRVIAVWSDMFDPYFNATSKHYYHVNGSLTAAAGAVDRDVLILSWNDKPVSYGYWANRGNKQIVPLCFDHDDLTINQEESLVRQAKRYGGSFVGWMYSTWKRRYDEVERYGMTFGRGVRAFEGRHDRRASAPSLGFAF